MDSDRSRHEGGVHPSPTDESLTWASLLAHWTQFARTAVAFPRTGEGARWRGSVAPAIGLQALAFALGDVGRLPADERELSFDRAETLIRRYASELNAAWRGEAFPGGLSELLGDAERALRLARERRAE